MTSREPEYLGPGAGAPAEPRGRRRLAVLGTAGALVAGVIGVGAWGVGQLLAGGTSPSSAVPGNAVAYFAVDLDPSAGQKVEALKTLRKLDSIKTGLGARDDLRRSVFRLFADECQGVDYDRDIEPWLGDRAAFALVPGKKHPVPFVVVQVKDEGRARTGVQRLAACDGGDGQVGTAKVGEYLVVAGEQEEATWVAAEAGRASLAEDSGFNGWVDRAGGAGVVTAYLAKEAPGAYLDLMMGMDDAHVSGCLVSNAGECEQEAVPAGEAPTVEELFPGGAPTDLPSDMFTTGPDGKQRLNVGEPQGAAEESTDEEPLPGNPMESAFKDFEGLAATIRFEDGALAATVVSKGSLAGGLLGMTTPIGLTRGDESHVGDLPPDTAVAFGLAFDEGWLARYLESLGGTFRAIDMPEESFREDLEKELGVTVEELERALGTAAAVAVDPSVTEDDLDADGPQELARVSVGLRIVGEPSAIRPTLDKIIATAGKDAQGLVVVNGDGVIGLSFNAAYAERLASKSGLADEEHFRDAVPEADGASGVVFVDLDAANVQRLVAEIVGNDKDARALRALGITDRTRDGYTTDEVRLTLD